MKKKMERPLSPCRDCARVYERYSAGADGKPVLGRCKEKDHAVLLGWDTCDKHKRKG